MPDKTGRLFGSLGDVVLLLLPFHLSCLLFRVAVVPLQVEAVVRDERTGLARLVKHWRQRDVAVAQDAEFAVERLWLLACAAEVVKVSEHVVHHY